MKLKEGVHVKCRKLSLSKKRGATLQLLKQRIKRMFNKSTLIDPFNANCYLANNVTHVTFVIKWFPNESLS